MKNKGFATLQFAFIIFFVLLAGTSHGQVSMDQVNNPAWMGGAVNITPANTVSQDFVPSLSCLTAVETALKTGNRGKGGDQVTLTILDLSGRTLASASANISEGFEGFQRFNFPGSGVSVTPGRPIRMTLRDTGKNVFWWKYIDKNPYPAGSSWFHGTPFEDNDFFFRTYGTNGCQSFSLTVTSDPVNLSAGGSQNVTISVSRQGGFTGPVTATFPSLPSGITVKPIEQTISGNSAVATISAVTTAVSGAGTLRGISGALVVQKNFQVQFAAPAAPHIGSVTPAMQQKGGAIMITGTNFDSTCSNNVVKVGSVSTTPTNCSATSLTVQVPPQASYGQSQITVISGGRQSNSVYLTVTRQAGNFVEITNDIVSQRSSGRSCSTGAVRVDVCPPNCSGYLTGAHVAFFKNNSNNAGIGGANVFFDHNSRVGNIGGVGFSLCNVGIVLNGDATASMPQLMSFSFLDLETGKYFAAPYPFNWVTPDGKASYSPRIFRSPDGTIILVITPANIGPSYLTAGFIDKVSARVIATIPMNQIYGAIAASVTGKQVQFSFGGTQYGPISVP